MAREEETTVHIDADQIVYAVGFASDKNGDPLEYCLGTVKKVIKGIVAECDADNYILYLSGEDNFRDDVATFQPYKGNRKAAHKPKYYKEIRQYMQAWHPCHISENQEADDDVGIAMTKPHPENELHIVAHQDKDINMIPGKHYNWKKKELYDVTEDEANVFFLEQLLTGDSTDNIPGLFRLTGVKASAGLKKRVRDFYNERREHYSLERAFDASLMKVSIIYAECLGYDRLSEELGIDVKSMSADDIASIIDNGMLDELSSLLWIKRDGYEACWDYAHTPDGRERVAEIETEDS